MTEHKGTVAGRKLLGKRKVVKPKSLHFPVGSECQFRFRWPSYRTVPEHAKGKGKKKRKGKYFLVPEFGPCECEADKKAICTFNEPPSEDADAPMKCSTETTFTCIGDMPSTVDASNKTAVKHWVNTWCGEGKSGLM